VESVTYSIVETFLTLQGEGSRAGTRAVFVRFAGCNLWNGRPEGRATGAGACALWCDTRFTGGTRLTAEQIVDRCDEAWPEPDQERWAVLSGGEPSLQLDAALVAAFRARAWRLAIETNGTQQNAALELLDHVTLSPKKGPPVLVRRCTDLKVVLPGWTEAELLDLERTIESRFRFVQPQDPPRSLEVEDTDLRAGEPERVRATIQECLAFVHRNPGWRLGLQLHKLLDLP
jgi:organic radical activating enzyme